MFRLESSAIVLLNSVSTLSTFNNRTILPASYSMKQQLFIYLPDGTFNKVAMMFLHLPIFNYEYFVIEEDKWIRLLTFVWFTKTWCGPHLKEVNRFDKSTNRWHHKNFKTDKFSNCHGCPINFLFNRGLPEFIPMEVDHKNKSITKCIGCTCAIVSDFSSSLNYKYHMNMYYESNVLKKMWPQIPHHLVVRSVVLNQGHRISNKLAVATRPFYDYEVGITVPPGEEYSGYEKMHLPFDGET